MHCFSSNAPSPFELREDSTYAIFFVKKNERNQPVRANLFELGEDSSYADSTVFPNVPVFDQPAVRSITSIGTLPASAALRTLCALYNCVSMPASYSTNFSHLEMVSGVTASCGFTLLMNRPSSLRKFLVLFMYYFKDLTTTERFVRIRLDGYIWQNIRVSIVLEVCYYI